MKVSDRVSALRCDGDDGWALFTAARERKARGIDVINLTVGEPDSGTPKVILDAMNAAAQSGATGYAPIPGLPSLREAIAARTERLTGVPTGTENVFVTPGGQAALFAALTATADPGDTVAFLEPYFTSYPNTVQATGAIPQPIPCLSENGFHPTLQDMRDGTQSARVLMVNTPNNPTGAVYPPKVCAQIAQVAQEQDLWLISDEVYETQVWTGRHHSPRAVPDMADRTLVVNSVSKTFAMTGSRLGWVIAPADVVDAMSDFANATTFGVATFVQEAARWALTQGDRFEADVAAPVAARNALAQRWLRNHPTLTALPADGAMYIMVDVRRTGHSGHSFALDLLDKENIAVMPGENFGAASAGHIRLALTVAEPRLEHALDRLCRFAERLAA